MEQFEDEIRVRFRPVIAVCQDRGVELACAKNGLTFVDLLRQHADRVFTDERQAPPMRVTENLTIRPDKSFSVRFYDVAALHATPTATADKHLSTLMQQILEGQTFPNDVLERLIARKGQPGQDLSPWFTEYAKEFMRTLLFGSHEMMDSPLTLVYGIDASNVDCNAIAESLLNKSIQRANEPPGMSHEVLYPFHDTTFPRHFVLVHNCADTTLDRETVEAKFEALQNGRLRKKGGFSLVRINSGSGGPDEAGASINWAANRHPSLPGPTNNGVVATGGEPLEWPEPTNPGDPWGCYLSNQDLKEFQTLVQDIVIYTLLPNMEARMGKLRVATEEHRSRMNKVVKSFASLVGIVSSTNRSAQTGQTAADGGLFKYTSPEGMMRHFGDMAFMLGAYDAAEEYFRHIAEEFGKAKAAKNHGAACEAVALARFMQPDKSDDVVWRYFVDAFDAYASMDTKMCKAYAVRSALLHAKAYISVRRFSGAWSCFTQAAHLGEGPMKPLMLEQAAHCKAMEPEPKHRKFSKYMVLAGLNYCNMGFVPLGIVTLQQGVRTLEGKPWHLIRNELAHRLGNFCRKQAMWREAALCLQETLQHAETSDPTFQARALEAFMAILDGAMQVNVNLYNDPKVMQLPVPRLDEKYCLVQISGHRVAGNLASQEVRESEWAVIEDRLVSPTQMLFNPATESRKFPDGVPYSATFADEEVYLHVRFKNPLAIPLNLRNIRLACVFQPKDKRFTSIPTNIDALLMDLAPPDKVVVKQVDVQMKPGELVTLRLSAKPKVAGWLHIGAVVWDVFLQEPLTLHASACSMLRPRAARAKCPDHDTSLLIARATRGMNICRAAVESARVAPSIRHPRPSQRLTMQIIPPSPLLVLQPAIATEGGTVPTDPLPSELVAQLFKGTNVTSLPEQLYVGEIAALHLVAANYSRRNVQNIRIGTSTPCVAIVPSLGNGAHTSLEGVKLMSQLAQFQAAEPPALEPVTPRESVTTVPPTSIFQLATSDSDWHLGVTEAGPGSFLPVTVWVNPQAPGPVVILLVLYFEDSDGKCRVLRFTHTIQVAPALSQPSIKIAPAVNSLTHFSLELGLASKLTSPHAALTIREVMCTSPDWRICSTSEPDEDGLLDPDVFPQTSAVAAGDVLPTSGSFLTPHLRYTLAPTRDFEEASVQPTTSDASSAALSSSKRSVAPKMPERTINMAVLWELPPDDRPNSPAKARKVPTIDSVLRFGIIHIRGVTLMDDNTSSALRMVATHPPLESLAPVWSAETKARPSITPIPVKIRVRNCCAYPMTLCIEGGVSASAMVPAPQINAGSWMSSVGSGYRLPLTPPLATLGACRRHQWAGQMRVHVSELGPLQEHTCDMLVLLHGVGVFVVEDYVCTWSIPELGVTGSSTPGNPIVITLGPTTAPSG